MPSQLHGAPLYLGDYVQVTNYLLDQMFVNAGSGGTVGVLAPTATFLGVASTIVSAGTSTSLGNVTPATGEISLPVAIGSWVGPYKLANSQVAIQAPNLEFTVTNPSAPQVISAWYLTNATVSGTLLGFGLIAPPVTLQQGGAPLTICLRIVLDPGGTWSAEVVFDG